MTDQYDLAVLGSGPGGYVAAIRAAQLGLKTVIIERESLGGICLNWGCIPTKALLRSSEMLHAFKNAQNYGIAVDAVRPDLNAIVDRSRKVAKRLNNGVGYLLQKHKVDVIFGAGKLTDKNKLSVVLNDKAQILDITANNIIIATGGRARNLPFAPADGKRIWTYRTALLPPEMPERLLVVGSGAIGIEFASFYHEMGSEVTIVEIMDTILPVEDKEVSAFMHKALKGQGMNIITKARLSSLDIKSDGLIAEITREGKKGDIHEFSHAIIAAGIVPNSEGIGLEALGIQLERGHIVTDKQCRTNVDNIYAIGDITQPPWLAHKASHEGVIAAEAIAGQLPHGLDVSSIPACTYCRPQIASVGLTEEQASQAGHSLKVGRFPFIANGKAIAMGETDGFVKTIFDADTGELLGAHMVGAEVTELIQGYTVGKTLETTEQELMDTVFPHPTLSEMMHESVLDAFDREIHY